VLNKRGASEVRVESLKNQALIADKCIVAECFLSRLKGLIGRSELARGEGLLLPRCNNVHMWFMSIAIDVVFLRKKEIRNGVTVYEISSVRERVRPWKLLPVGDFKASETLELPAGVVRERALSPGDELCIASR
jgi:uncharacterized membrane protein (UPF0127 family)